MDLTDNYIIEFTEPKLHAADDENPMIYKRLYPGFLGEEKDGTNLCIPCCFNRTSTDLEKIDDNTFRKKIKRG